MAATQPISSAALAEVPGYAKVTGIAGLILAVVSVIIHVAGVLFLTPLAVIMGSVALYGHYKGIGIAILIISVVNLLISPTFWLNTGASSTISGVSGNRFLTYLDLIGVIVMFTLVVRRRK